MNGVLGAETELAVLSFQQERNLSRRQVFPLRQLWLLWKTDELGGWLFLLLGLAAVSTLADDRAFSNYKHDCKARAFTQAPSAEFLML